MCVLVPLLGTLSRNNREDGSTAATGGGGGLWGGKGGGDGVGGKRSVMSACWSVVVAWVYPSAPFLGCHLSFCGFSFVFLRLSRCLVIVCVRVCVCMCVCGVCVVDDRRHYHCRRRGQ